MQESYMKITDIKVYPMVTEITSRRRERVSDSRARVGWVFVQVETDEGITGTGECTNWPRNGDILVSHGIETIKDAIIGRDPNHIEAIWQEIYRNYTYLGSRGPITTLISGIDIALWDIKGKALGRPIYDLLGGPVRDDIPLYTHPAYGTPEAMAESSREAVDEGYVALKTDPFWEEMGKYHTARMSGYISKQGEHRGADIIAAIRDEVGPEVEIMIDAHGHYDVASAIRCAKALEPYNLTWFEEPVPPEGYEALRQVRDSVNVPICTGERFYTRWDFLPVLRDRLADYLMCDVCWTGGITELKKVSTMAETYYVNMSPHGSMGPIQLVAGAHTMMTVPNFYRLEMFHLWQDAFNAAMDTPLDIRDGILYLPDKPGLGFGLNMDFIEANPDPGWG
jgi:galactonate dehydratase